MIKRLLWKEFREQGPFALAALGLVPALLFYDRMVGGDHRPWPSFPTDLWLVFGVLVAWGATRMPREREPSRLSLRALPVRWWQTWALKALPGIAWAGVCTAFACAIGRVGVAATDDGAGGWVVWITAGSMASAYACAFLAGLFWGVGASAVLGLVVGTMAWAALESPSPDYAARAARELWLWVATVPVASAAVMAARARGSRPRRIGLSAAGAYSCLAALRLAPVIGTTHWGNGYPHWVLLEPVASQSAGLVAYVEEATRTFKTAEGETKVVQTGYRLCVRNLDGTGRRVVSESDPAAALVWTPAGELVFRQLSWLDRRDKLRLWSPKTGEARVVVRRPAEEWGVHYDSPLGALEPNGKRLALVYERRGSRLGLARNRELWAVDLRTGSRRLLYPDIWTDELLWRDGRIYLKERNNLWSLSPEGGELRRESYLPPPEGVRSP